MSVRVGSRSVRPAVAIVALATMVALLPETSRAQTQPPGDPDGFDEIISFEDYDLGGLDGQDGWQASDTVEVAPDPANEDNQVIHMGESGDRAFRSVPGIDEGETGTVFFRLYRNDTVDTNAGLSAAESPDDFPDYEVQANLQESPTLNARDGGGFTAVGTVGEGVWQCVWMVADNDDDSYRMYSLGGPYEDLTQLPVDGDVQFDFRNGTTDALERFFAANGNQTGEGDAFYDDIAIDTSGENLAVPGGDAGQACQVQLDEDTPLVDPLGRPGMSDLVLTVEELAQLPESAPFPEPTDGRIAGTRARVNHVGELPDGSGRLAVPDLNGPMYLIDDGEITEYLDIGDEFDPYFWNHAGLGSGFGFVAFHPEFADNGTFYTVHSEGHDLDERPEPSLPHWDEISRHGVVTEWMADDPASSTFSGTNREVLRLGYLTNIHGMQQIGFNPLAEPGDEDYGLLYVASGDGGDAHFTDVAQDTSRAEGTILRIDPLGDDSDSGEYGIPASNPFLDDDDALDEIYAYGLRNPHRFSWDPATGRMLLGNIGDWHVEAIYEVRAGDNFGWSEREGPFLLGDDRWIYEAPDPDPLDFVGPVAAYSHPRPLGVGGDLGYAVVGGHVYRGDEIPEIEGLYVFTDIVDGKIYTADADDLHQEHGELAEVHEVRLRDAASGEIVTMKDLAEQDRVDTRLGIDAAGELYISAKANGKIWKITGADTEQIEFPSCEPGDTVVSDVVDEADWDPVTPEKWKFPGDEVVLAEAGEERPGPRRPFEYAVLSAGPEWRSAQIDAEVRVDVPEPVGRDVIILFGFQSDTEFYYVHLSEDNEIYAHNGIFVVNDADRERIDDQWDGEVGAPPAIAPGMEWHRVRIVHCADAGEIAVYVDDLDTPLMTATDATFDSGRVGFGSFDDIGRIRNLAVTGQPVAGQEPDEPVWAVLDPVVPDGLESWYVSPVTLTLESEDAEAVLQYRASGDDEWIDVAEPITIDEDGTHDLEYRAYWPDGDDGDNDDEAPSEVHVEVGDTYFDPDDISIAQGGTVTFERVEGAHDVVIFDEDGEVVASNEVSDQWDTFEFTADDAGSFTFICTPHVNVGMEGTLEVVGDGGADPGDGTSSDVYEVSLGLDQTPPQTSVSLDGEQHGEVFSGEVELSLDALDETSGVAQTHLRTEGDGEEISGGPVTFGEDGHYELEVRSVDVAGNIEDWQQVSFEIDTGGLPVDPDAHVCDDHQGGATFPDAPGSGHRYFIDCLAELGIVQGMTDGSFHPARDVSRGQLASFVVRAMELARGETMPVGGELFDDVSPHSVHGQAISKLHNAGIIHGYGDGTFRPGEAVTRDQTARYVVNALETLLDETLERSGVTFPDVGASQYASDIDALATAGIVSGFPDGSYGPRRAITRGQMTRVIGNTLDVHARRAGGPPDDPEPSSPVLESFAPYLVNHWNFENPAPDDPATELDLGFSGTGLWLVNGEGDMRVEDPAHPGSTYSLQTQQVNPQHPPTNEDWKAGIYDVDGVESLEAYTEVEGTTIMGFFKQTGPNPSRNTNSEDPDAMFNAVGMAGILSGDSDGHPVRSLLEVIDVDGELRLVGLARRLDDQPSNIFAASQDWDTLFPADEWAHIAATFDFTDGTMALYKDGQPLDGFLTDEGDPWELDGDGPHLTSPELPNGIKIGGSYPQNTGEQNPCNCRMDELKFLNRAASAEEIAAQYALYTDVDGS